MRELLTSFWIRTNGLEAAHEVFKGGSEEAEALYGKRVKALRALKGVNVYVPRDMTRRADTLDIPAGAIGFMGRPPAEARQTIIIAFAKSGNPPDTIDQLLKRPLTSVQIGWIQFRVDFSVDV